MKLRCLTYMLLLLMTFQSSVSLADMHAPHQTGFDHLTFEDHQHAVNVVEQLGVDERDCHHCCHCHGHICIAVIISSEPTQLNKATPILLVYLDKAPLETFESFLRPPIA